MRREADAEVPPVDGADHLHSVAEFKGYYVHAVDGDIGYVENIVSACGSVSTDLLIAMPVTRPHEKIAISVGA